MSKNDGNPNELKAKKHTGSYKIGYKHPPLHSKFKKGVSGNSAGRPKKELNLDLLLLKLLNKLVSIKQNGKLCKISYAELSLRHLVKSAASGKPQALNLLFKWAEKAEMAAKKLNNPDDVDNFDWNKEQEKLFQELEISKNSNSGRTKGARER